MTLSKPIAFFDVDGPLYNGYSLTNFFRFLRKRGEYPDSAMDAAEKIFSDFKAGVIPYNEATRLHPEALAAGLKGLNVQRIGCLAEEFRPEFESNLRSYAKVLLRTISQKYFIAAVSTTNTEVIHLLENYGVSTIIATEFETVGGFYTGRIGREVSGPVHKLAAVQRIAAERGVPLSECIAFGDSVGDELMLDAVGHAFALFPDRELKEKLPTKHWTVINNADEVLDTVKTQLSL